uniref:Uncharacterized protein n=1 Tax=Arundo donax TaxID=35708 RepID=A0A0A9B0M6_ARUDO
MVKVAKTLEEQLALHKSRIQQHTTRIQALKAQIQELNTELRQVEDACDQEGSLKEVTAKCLDRHKEQFDKATALKAELKAISTQGCYQLQTLEQTIADFTDQDDMGLSKRAHSLLDFFISSISS